ncbi:MAG: membrane protein insertase YidC [Oscillospiraceae bacterium]|nr:membrane protein insertase YidC [Oscillospiraceae bacterium]
MGSIMGLIAYPLGWIMKLLYSVIPNYGLVILVFTLVTKILLIPMAVKQHKSMISRTKLQPKMIDLKNKYGNNPQKYQEEMMGLYQREGVNPASGCGSSLIQLPILFGMLGVVYAPLKYILGLSDEVINKASKITVGLIGKTFLNSSGARSEQYAIIKSLKESPEAFRSLGKDVVNNILDLKFNFLGMDLSRIPSVPRGLSEINWLILIPVLSGLTSLLVSLQSMKNNSSVAVDEASAQAAQSMKFMMFLTPAISAWASFKFPAAVGLYWIFSNMFIIIQNYMLYKKYNPTQVILKAKEEMILKKEQERQERIEARKKLSNLSDVSDIDEKNYKGLSQKEINKIKLANARKRDAQKYGDYDD